MPDYRLKLVSSLSNSEKGRLFEEAVRQLFELMGFVTEHDTRLGSAQVDLVVTRQEEFGQSKILIECKYGAVNDDIVKIFNGIYAGVRDAHRFTRGAIITNSRFTSSAKEQAAQFNVALLSYEDLLNRLIDFMPYLRQAVRTYEEDDPLYRYYVELSYVRSGSGRFPENTSCRGETLVSESPDGRSFVAKGNITEYADAWLDRDDIPQLCLLGTYGSGKTSFCRHYFHRKAKDYLRDPTSNRIPVLIPLSRYSKALGLEEMVTAFLANECGVRLNASHEVFMTLAERGKLLLLLDGFDEMATQVDANVRRANFKELAKLVTGASKLIISGRPNYFLTAQEMSDVLTRTFNRQDPYAVDLVNEEQLASWEILEVAPFDRMQIELFLRNHSDYLRENGVFDWQDLLKAIDDTYNIEELARNPVLLDVIVKTVPRIRRKVSDINATRLYGLYTGFWLDREYDKGHFRWLINRQEKEAFLEQVAWQMLATDTLEVHYSQLSDAIRQHFRLNQAKDIEYFSSDIRTCTYLVHSREDGKYRFLHKSFMEYFCACRLFKMITTGEVSVAVAPSRVTKEVLFFLFQMLDGRALTTLHELPLQVHDEGVKTFLLDVASRLFEVAVEFYTYRGNMTVAEDWGRRLLAFGEAHGDPRVVLRAHFALTGILRAVGRLADAVVLSEKALGCAREMGDRDSEATALLGMADLMSMMGRYAEGIECAERCLCMARELGNRSTEMDVLLRLGTLCVHMARYDRACEFLEMSYVISRKLGIRRAEMIALINLGGVFLEMGELSRARERYGQSLETAQLLGDRRSESYILTRLADLMQSEGSIEEARVCLERAVDIFRALGDRVSEGQTLLQLGELLVKESRPEEAEQRFRDSLAIALEMGNMVSESVSLRALGILAAAQGAPDEAEKRLEHSLRVSEEIGDRRTCSETLACLGEVLTVRGKMGDARQQLLRSLKISEEIGDRATESRTVFKLGKLAEAEEDKASAIGHYKKCIEISEAIGHKEMAKEASARVKGLTDEMTSQST